PADFGSDTTDHGHQPASIDHNQSAVEQPSRCGRDVTDSRHIETGAFEFEAAVNDSVDITGSDCCNGVIQRHGRGTQTIMVVNGAEDLEEARCEVKLVGDSGTVVIGNPDPG